jgi:hypothetical protein
MTNFPKFPQGEALWLVRWIDEFRVAHGTSISPSVHVLLQRLEESEVALQSLTADRAAALWSQPSEDIEDTKVVPILVGYLPGLSVGQVYRAGRLVFELPARRKTITLADGEADGEDVGVRDIAAAPPWWGRDFPHPALSPFEFPSLTSRFERSRCLVLRDATQAVVVPRIVIFRSFYGLHSELARAFCSGTYDQAMKRLVSFEEHENGLRTCVDEIANEWHIIVQRRVPNAFARLLAILLFDPFARQCAEELYSQSLQQRGGNALASWHCRAKLPFHGALTLRLKGYDLAVNSSAKHRLPRFLVTAITAAPVPGYLLPIHAERSNSNSLSNDPRPGDTDTTYASRSRTKPTPSFLRLETDADADQDYQSFRHDIFSFEWLGAGPVPKIEKQSHKCYGGNHLLERKHAHRGVGSAGEPGGAGGAAPVDVGTTVRKRNKSFLRLLELFEELVKDGRLDRAVIVQPDEPSRRVEQGGVPCWNFLDDRARVTGVWPKRAWVMVKESEAVGRHPRPVPRACMLVELHSGGSVGLWAEIESEAKGGYLSPLLVADGRGIRADPGALVDLIAQNKGRNLKRELAPVVGADDASIGTYKHCYGQDGRITATSVVRFLSRQLRLVPAQGEATRPWDATHSRGSR